MTKQMRFKDFYNLHTKQAFVKKVAKVTHKSPSTVMMWIHGGRVPDALTQAVLAKEFGVKEEDLFPHDKARG